MERGSACQGFGTSLIGQLGDDDSNDEYRFQLRAAEMREFEKLQQKLQDNAGYHESLLSAYYRLAHSLGLQPQVPQRDSEIESEQIDQNQNHQQALGQESDFDLMADEGPDEAFVGTQIESLRASMASKTAQYSRLSGMDGAQVLNMNGGYVLRQCTDEASLLKALERIVANLDKSLKAWASQESQLHDGQALQQRPSITSGSTSGSGSGDSSKSGKTTKETRYEFYDRFAATALEATKNLEDHEMLALPIADWNHELKPTKRMKEKNQICAEPRYAFNFYTQYLKACAGHEEGADVFSIRHLVEMFQRAHAREKPTPIFNDQLLGHGVNGKNHPPYLTPQCFRPKDILEAAERKWPDLFKADVVERLKNKKADVRNQKRDSRDLAPDGETRMKKRLCAAEATEAPPAAGAGAANPPSTGAGGATSPPSAAAAAGGGGAHSLLFVFFSPSGARSRLSRF